MWYWYVFLVREYSIAAVVAGSLPGVDMLGCDPRGVLLSWWMSSLYASYALYLSRTNGLIQADLGLQNKSKIVKAVKIRQNTTRLLESASQSGLGESSMSARTTSLVAARWVGRSSLSCCAFLGSASLLQRHGRDVWHHVSYGVLWKIRRFRMT